MFSRRGSVALTRVYVLGVVISVAILSQARLQAQNARLWGVVKDAATQAPLVAEISIVHAEGPEMVFLHARTDTNGWYQAGDIPSGRAFLVVRAEGHGFSVREILVELGQTVGPVDFQLEKAATLRGQVVDEQGLPLAGASVRSVYLVSAPVFFDWQVGETTTNAAGEFLIRDVTPNLDFYVEASDREFPVRFSASSLRLSPGEARQGPPLTLKRGVIVTGQVVDASGALLAGVEVWLIARQLHLPDPTAGKSKGLREETNRRTLTDAQGNFAFQGVGNGAHLLIARRAGYAKYQEKVRLNRGVASSVNIQVALSPQAP